MLLGRWSDEEHERFLEALRIYGKDWDKIQKHLGTRDAAHCRSHAQKFLIKLEKQIKQESSCKNTIENARFYHDILSKKIEKPNRKFRFLEHFDKLWNQNNGEGYPPYYADYFCQCDQCFRIANKQPLFNVSKDAEALRLRADK